MSQKVFRMGYSPIDFKEEKRKFVDTVEIGLIEKDVVVMRDWREEEFGFIHPDGNVQLMIEDKSEQVFEIDELEAILNQAKEFKAKQEKT